MPRPELTRAETKVMLVLEEVAGGRIARLRLEALALQLIEGVRETLKSR